MAARLQPAGVPNIWPDIPGVMAGLIRSQAWCGTALGATETWPQSLRTIVELMLQSQLPAAVCWGADLVTLFNDACIALLDGRHAQVLGKPFPDVLPNTWLELAPMMEAALAGVPQQVPGEAVRRAAGQEQGSRYSWSLIPIRDDGGRIAGLFCSATETTLQTSDRQLRTMLENAREGIFLQDVRSNRTSYLSPVMEQLTGFSLEELYAMSEPEWVARVHPDGREEVRRQIEDISSGALDEGTTEMRWRTKGGGYRWLTISRKLMREPAGAPLAFVGVCGDITDRKQAEEALRVSERRYRLLYESLRDGFVLADMDGRMLECNDAVCQMLGYEPGEIRALTYNDITPERWHAIEAAIVRDQILVRGYSDVFEKEYVRKDGTVFPVELRVVLLRDEAGNPESLWATVRDISERKASEAHLHALNEELIHVGRVSELSQVSAGIAHELNQPLAAMLNYTSTAKRMLETKDENAAARARQFISKAGEQAERAGEIIRRMRDFVEKRHTHRKSEQISPIIADAQALGLIGTKTEGIVFQCHCADDLPEVMADRVQVQQVLVNLMRNAIESMSQSERRELTITIDPCDIGVEVSVADTGSGIPGYILEKLFQPFVTTKAGGMGIGLAISRSIIESHGGQITAAAREGGGTVFRFTLPAAVP